MKHGSGGRQPGFWTFRSEGWGGRPSSVSHAGPKIRLRPPAPREVTTGLLYAVLAPGGALLVDARRR
jgi:hypothetical protein